MAARKKVTPKRKPKFRWRTTKRCEDCPFNPSGPGLILRESLNGGRWDEIKRGLLAGAKFDCHQTTKETGNGTNLYCAGALEFQRSAGIHTDYMTLCKGLEGVAENKEELFRRLKLTARKRRGAP